MISLRRPSTVVWTADGTMQTAGGCEDMTFEPCGGDLVRTWEISLGCLTLPVARTRVAA